MVLLNWLFALWLALAPPLYFGTVSNTAGTGANDTAIGTRPWNLASGVTGAEDDNWASSDGSVDGLISNYLKVTDFGLSVPGGSTVVGVQFDLRGYQVQFGTGSIQWNVIKLVSAAGTVLTNDQAALSANLPSGTSNSTVTLGGPSNTWGSDALLDWNDADAGVVLSVKWVSPSDIIVAAIDSCTITVTYTVPGQAPAVRRTIVGQARKLELLQMETT